MSGGCRLGREAYDLVHQPVNGTSPALLDLLNEFRSEPPLVNYDFPSSGSNFGLTHICISAVSWSNKSYFLIVQTFKTYF